MHRQTTCFLLLAVVAAAAAGVACRRSATTSAPSPPEVYVAAVVQQDVPDYLDLVGQTVGFQDVEIRARVEGFLQTMDFREGSFVRKGALLYQIDPKPLQAVLDAAVADKATAQARLTKATNDVLRYTPLVSRQAVSRQELDDARSAQEAASSQVAAAAAAVEKATLDLGYTRVVSPINGLVGTTRVKPGNLVGKGEPTLLTVVSQIDPILFHVGLTEADFLRLARREPSRIGEPPRTGGIELTLADGTRHPQTGRVYAVDRQVDPATGTLGIQIEFPNPAFILRPGQYGRARAVIGVQKNALLVPQRAVQEIQNLYTVAVVRPDNTVAFRNVTVGPRVDTRWVVERGLAPGDVVVAEGLQRVRDGMAVRTRPFAEAPAEGAAN